MWSQLSAFRIILLSLAALSSACSSLSIVESYAQSERYPMTVPPDSVAYYLPKQLVAIEIERKKPASTPSPENPGKKKPAPKESRAKGVPKQVATGPSNAALVPLTSSGSASEPSLPSNDAKTADDTKTGKAADDAKKDDSKAPDDKSTKDDAKPPATTPAPATNTPAETNLDGMVDTISVTLLPPVPDTRRRFYAHINHSIARDDEYTIQTTDAGLLTSSSATSTDETGQILLKLVSLVTEVKKHVATFAFDGGTPAPTCGTVGDMTLVSPTEPHEFKATIIIDPTDPTELKRAESKLCTLGAHYRFATSPLGTNTPITSVTESPQDVDSKSPPLNDRVAMAPNPQLAIAGAAPSCSDASAASAHKAGNTSDSTSCIRGLLYRRAEPYLLSIYKVDAASSKNAQFVDAAFLSLPNKSPVERIALPVDAAVTTKQSAKFANGMLIENSATRPSSLVGVVTIPVDVAKAIVSIPSALFQFKVDSTTSETALVNAQTAQLKAQTDQLEQLLKLKEAQDKQNNPSPSTDVPEQ